MRVTHCTEHNEEVALEQHPKEARAHVSILEDKANGEAHSDILDHCQERAWVTIETSQEEQGQGTSKGRKARTERTACADEDSVPRPQDKCALKVQPCGHPE